MMAPDGEAPLQTDLVQVRRDKLEKLRARGIDPYPHSFTRTHTSEQARALLADAESESSDSGDPANPARAETVTIAGRMMAVRGMGKATFVDVKDPDGRIQALLRRNTLGDSYELLDDLDIGDWIGVSGPVIRTRTGEATVEGQTLTVLSKAIRPLPEKWHGLADTEVRFRQRYLDLIANDDAQRVAVLRSKIVSSMRRFLDGQGFMEVETPVLVPVAAGAMARPFVTHHNQLNADLFMRIATELYLKRLIVGGLEKVYEIGRVFRNEGVDFYHNPEFTMMESYQAFADYNDVMVMVEHMVSTIAKEALGKLTVEFDGNEIDLTPPWPRLSLRQQLIEHAGIDFLEYSDLDSLATKMRDMGLDTSGQISWAGLLDKAVSDTVEPKLIQPSFLIDYPVEMSPLAKRHRDDPRVAERFEGFVAGMEICNSFTELNDPVDQRVRFEEQEALRVALQDAESEEPKEGGEAEEVYDRLDEDFLVAIEHGMPPTGGLGLGVDRLAMLLSGHRSIREVILFPQLRPR
jgi:lysyl-tRNA synthetase class 2